MSWTPTFLIKKEELNKVLEKEYKFLLNGDLQGWMIENTTSNAVAKIEKLEKQIEMKKEEVKTKMPGGLSEKEFKHVFEERVHTQTSKLLEKINTAFTQRGEDIEKEFGWLVYVKDVLKDVLSDPALLVAIEDTEYYYSYTGLTSEANSLVRFCDDTDITYAIIGG